MTNGEKLAVPAIGVFSRSATALGRSGHTCTHLMLIGKRRANLNPARPIGPLAASAAMAADPHQGDFMRHSSIKRIPKPPEQRGNCRPFQDGRRCRTRPMAATAQCIGAAI